MRLSRTLTRGICRMLAGMLLFAQMMMAAHACPAPSGMGGMNGTPAAMSAMAATAGDDSMPATSQASTPTACDPAQPAHPSLCHEHCRSGQQTTDTPPAPVAHAPVPALLYALDLEADVADRAARLRPADDPVLEVAPPPHALLHCVLRN